MGSARLKKKETLHYQKQPRGSETLCCTCNNYVADFPRTGIGDTGLLSIEPRCKVMGMEASVKYRIRPDHGCDAHDNTLYLARIGRKAGAL